MLTFEELIEITAYINKYRILHKAKPIIYNTDISAFSQFWADNILSTKEFKHSANHKYGENLFSMSSTRKVKKISVVTTAIDCWYKEVNEYDFDNPQFTHGTGHFTQLVWDKTKFYGIGYSYKNGKSVVCMNFDPPGNCPNKFEQNVFESG